MITYVAVESGYQMSLYYRITNAGIIISIMLKTLHLYIIIYNNYYSLFYLCAQKCMDVEHVPVLKTSNVLCCIHVASNTGWIISIIILAILLLILILMLIVVITMYCKKLSVITKMTTQPTRDLELAAAYHEFGRYVNLTPQTTRSAFTLQPNPSYGVVLQPMRNRELNDNYDYVVSDDEVIKTNQNPSYVPTTVGGNQMEDNPAYNPAFVAVI